jgi:hypothetical protein
MVGFMSCCYCHGTWVGGMMLLDVLCCYLTILFVYYYVWCCCCCDQGVKLDVFGPVAVETAPRCSIGCVDLGISINICHNSKTDIAEGNVGYYLCWDPVRDFSVLRRRQSGGPIQSPRSSRNRLLRLDHTTIPYPILHSLVGINVPGGFWADFD